MSKNQFAFTVIAGFVLVVVNFALMPYETQVEIAEWCESAFPWLLGIGLFASAELVALNEWWGK